MVLLLALHAGLALVLPLLIRRWGPNAFLVAATAPAITCIWALTHLPHILSGGYLAATYADTGELGIGVTFRIDALALLMVLLVTGVGSVIFVYCRWYFSARQPALPRVAGILVAFAGAMVGLVIADNLLLLYIFWELTTVCSFLLIGQADGRSEDRTSAARALLVTTGLGLPMLFGFVLLGEAGGTYRVSDLLAAPPDGAAVDVAVSLIAVGALAKAAQIPVHSWLPMAMVAATPVSAYLHAAAMVKAGPYLVARLAPAFNDRGIWQPLLVSVGIASMLVGARLAWRMDDLKLLLAYGTVSQLGFLIVLFASGTHAAGLAGGAMLLAHGLFKAPLFLVTGMLEQSEGTRRIGELAGAGRRRPVLLVIAAAATASMVGLPPFLGYVGKESALSALSHGGPLDLVVLAGVAIASMLTVAYSLRFLLGAFGGPVTSDRPEEPVPWGFALAPALLATAGLAGGLGAHAVDALVAPYARTLPGPSHGGLALWHGLSPTLALSALVLTCGAGLQLWRRTARFAESGPVLPDADTSYARITGAVRRVAAFVTGRTQVGSLPIYLRVILATVLALAGVPLLVSSFRAVAGEERFTAPPLADHPIQVVLGVVVLAAGAGAIAVRGRLSAIISLSVAGYGVGGLFIVHGAPDLALVTFLVDTLTLIMLALVLRRAPVNPTASRRSPAVKAVTGGISVAVGILVTTLLLVGTGLRTGRSPTAEYLAAAKEAGGTNVVNLILDDFRALDTLGEISVLFVATIGVVSLVLANGSGRAPGAVRTPAEAAETTAGSEGAPEPTDTPFGPRTLFLAVTEGVLTPAVLVFSGYLLFAGHHDAGGGFAAGLVAGIAFALRYVAGGARELVSAAPTGASRLLGAGLLLATLTGIGGLFAGANLLQHRLLRVDVPLIGHIEFPTSLLFGIGVYILVLGLVLTLLKTLGVRLGSDPSDANEAEAR